MKGICFECNQKREIVSGKDTCWKCHLSSLSVPLPISVKTERAMIAMYKDSDLRDKEMKKMQQGAKHGPVVRKVR